MGRKCDAKVEVEISDNEIASINILERRNERGESAERITDAMVAEQKINVDTVSGATNPTQSYSAGIVLFSFST